MPPIPPDHRARLEAGVVKARAAAERGASAALETLGVAERDKPGWLDDDRLALRRALRARARQLGGDAGMEGGLPLLVDEIAYEAWHRMLFARMLADNGLLRHPSGATVTLADCAELADEGVGGRGSGVGRAEGDAWDVAAHFAAAMLPGLFRNDDPATRVTFAPEDRQALERILDGLPETTFTSDDGLGWVYQFWQSKKKAEVNASGRKIGGADLSPVTQLFTEDYMVRFLLENSLGAWWAARHPESGLLREWDFLRFADDGTPAAGSFPGWPERAAEVTLLDPCCGSGHFLVAGFDMLRKMRMDEEGLDDGAAADAVLRDNLFGLELDPRCTQIATFAVALAAWKVGGHPENNPPQIACSGVPVAGSLEEWRRLAKGDDTLSFALDQLYALFKDAPTLGSLIDPRRALANIPPMLRPDWQHVEQALEAAPLRESETAVFARAAEDAALAATLLGGTYTLVATNVPYLTRSKQCDVLKNCLHDYHSNSRADIATAFIERCLGFASSSGSCALVTPQNWLFLGAYMNFRSSLLANYQIDHVSRVGSGSTATASWEVSRGLIVLSKLCCELNHKITGVDASQPNEHEERSRLLKNGPVIYAMQSSQFHNPDARILLVFDEKTRSVRDFPLITTRQHDQGSNPDSRNVVGAAEPRTLLEQYAESIKGLTTGDLARFVRKFWEGKCWSPDWENFQGAVSETTFYGGRESLFYWCSGQGPIQEVPGARTFAQGAWGHKGVVVNQIGYLPVTLYLGDPHDNNTAVIVPNDPSHLPAIWAFCSSPEFNAAVRRIDTALKVTNATLVKVPFDLERWQKVAAEQYPDGLPAPHSDDPTQWLFAGHPKGSDDPLQVAVARLLGYRWPEQPECDGLEPFADADGVVCLPPVGGEQPAHERLLALLRAAWGAEWSPAVQDDLLARAGSAGKPLDRWLRDDFWKQHVSRFHNRPFVWQIWDGQRDGFAALVNYHKLDRRLLEKLIYSYLGDYKQTWEARWQAGEAGAEGKALAARALQGKLEAILTGEAPHDVYVRWKPLARQPLGWEPDLNDGVRLNIRPFVEAGVLRGKFTVNWNKDRGANPAGSDVYRWAEEAQRHAGVAKPDGNQRLNDLHLTRAVKEAARAAEAES